MVGDRGWRRNATLALFILPSLVPLVLFTLGPMAASLGISLLRWDLLRPAKFIGLGNYSTLLSDPDFAAAVTHTLLFILGYLPLVYVGGLGLALLVNQKLRGSAFFRSAFFLPVVTSWVVVALVWRWLLNPQSGVVNAALGFLGIQGPGWWTDPAWAMPSVILASAWKDLGFVMVILLAGLQAIPEEYYEAAEVDGAGRSAALPAHHAAAALAVELLRAGDQPHQQLPGLRPGVGDDRRRPGRRVQRGRGADRPATPSRYNQMGYASAMSWVLFAVILAVTAIQFRLQRRWVNYV